MSRDRDFDPLTGFLVGAAAASAGLLAMRLYWQRVAPAVEDTGKELPPTRQTSTGGGRRHALDDIAIAGRQHREDESSTAAIGRIAYHGATGRDPSDEFKTKLSFGVHWGFGILMGGLYGALRRRAPFPDIAGGLLHGLGLWLLGDELAVPLLGLQGGPTKASFPQHLNRLGAHLAYGAGTAAATQAVTDLLAEAEARSRS